MTSSSKHVVAGMGRYDAEYIKYYTGVDSIDILWSLAEYTRNYSYHPINDEILMVAVDMKLASELQTQIPRYKMVDIKTKVCFMMGNIVLLH